jgi:hypothetical protein
MAMCRARTLDGTLCRNRVTVAGERCTHHRGRQNTAPIRTQKAYCGARKPDGRLCRSVVARTGERCHHHQWVAMPSAGIPRQRRPDPAPAPPRRTTEEQRRADRIRRAVDYCQDAAGSGALAAIEDHATEYISEETWNRIQRHWRGRHCDRLARYARGVLDGRQAVHRLAGRSAGLLAERLGWTPTAQTIADELICRIPIPIVDHEALVVSRGLQLIGVFMCITHNRPLTSCACFIDVVIAEGQEKMKQLLVRGAHDWRNLHVIGGRVDR